jgi:hypothetical protein
MPATNITLINLNITAPANFNLYNVKDLRIVDSQIRLTGGGNTFSLYNAQFMITNSASVTNVFSMDGLVGTNSLALYGTRAAMNDSTAIGVNPLTLSASTLSNSTSLALPGSSVVNFVLGTNNAAAAVAGNLTLSSTLNITNGGGFGTGTYTLFNYSGTLTGTPLLGAQPPGYNCSLNTNTAGQVNLLVSSTTARVPPTFGDIRVAAGGGSVVIRGSGGTPNGIYYVLTSTNVAVPPNQWTCVATNQFDGANRFLFTNAPDPNLPRSFYLLQLQ